MPPSVIIDGRWEYVVNVLLGVGSGVVGNALYETLKHHLGGLATAEDAELTREEAVTTIYFELQRSFRDAFSTQEELAESIVAETFSDARWSFEFANTTHRFEVTATRTMNGVVALIRRTRL